MNNDVKKFLKEENFDCKVFALIESEYPDCEVENLKDRIKVDTYDGEITIFGDRYKVYDEYDENNLVENYIEDVKEDLDRNSHYQYSSFIDAIDTDQLNLDIYDILDIESEIMYEGDLYYIEKC